MQHDIDSIIALCEKSIAAAKATDEAAIAKMTASREATRAKTVKRRKDAVKIFVSMAQRLELGEHLTDKQAQFLKGLHSWRKGDETILQDLTVDLNAPIKTGNTTVNLYAVELLAIMKNLKKSNDGKTTVSTSFLKDLGFGNTVIKWVARGA